VANGYTSAERSANAKKQLRDRKGRWIEMGARVRFLLNGVYTTGDVVGITPAADKVSVKTDDGKQHSLGSKALETVKQKADIDLAKEATKNLPDWVQKDIDATGPMPILNTEQQKKATLPGGESAGEPGKQGKQGDDSGAAEAKPAGASDVGAGAGDGDSSGAGGGADGGLVFDASTWKKVGEQGGSNPGGTYEAPDGSRYYVKFSKSSDHARNEVLADTLYKMAGVDTANLQLLDLGDGKLGTASPIMENAKQDLSSKMKSKSYLDKIREGFAADAWLANWDVAGLAYDNIVTDAGGKPVRIDPGGALLFRAMGSPKGGAFTAKAGEWDTLRSSTSPQASKLFKDMTPEQLATSAQSVTSVSDQDIDDAVDAMGFSAARATELKSKLKSRRDDISERAAALDVGTTPEPVDTAETPAGAALQPLKDISDALTLSGLTDITQELAEGSNASMHAHSEALMGDLDTAIDDVLNPPAGENTQEVISSLAEALEASEDAIDKLLNDDIFDADSAEYELLQDAFNAIQKVKPTVESAKSATTWPAVSEKTLLSTDANGQPLAVGDSFVDYTGKTHTIIDIKEGEFGDELVADDGQSYVADMVQKADPSPEKPELAAWEKELLDSVVVDDSPSAPTVPIGTIGTDSAGNKYVSDANGNPIYKGSTVKSKKDGLTGTVKTIEGNGAYVKVVGPDGKVKGRKINTLEVQKDTTPNPDAADSTEAKTVPSEPETPSVEADNPVFKKKAEDMPIGTKVAYKTSTGKEYSYSKISKNGWLAGHTPGKTILDSEMTKLFGSPIGNNYKSIELIEPNDPWSTPTQTSGPVIPEEPAWDADGLPIQVGDNVSTLTDDAEEGVVQEIDSENNDVLINQGDGSEPFWVSANTVIKVDPVESGAEEDTPAPTTTDTGLLYGDAVDSTEVSDLLAQYPAGTTIEYSNGALKITKNADGTYHMKSASEESTTDSVAGVKYAVMLDPKGKVKVTLPGGASPTSEKTTLKSGSVKSTEVAASVADYPAGTQLNVPAGLTYEKNAGGEDWSVVLDSGKKSGSFSDAVIAKTLTSGSETSVNVFLPEESTGGAAKAAVDKNGTELKVGDLVGPDGSLAMFVVSGITDAGDVMTTSFGESTATIVAANLLAKYSPPSESPAKSSTGKNVFPGDLVYDASGAPMRVVKVDDDGKLWVNRTNTWSGKTVSSASPVAPSTVIHEDEYDTSLSKDFGPGLAPGSGPGKIHVGSKVFNSTKGYTGVVKKLEGNGTHVKVLVESTGKVHGLAVNKLQVTENPDGSMPLAPKMNVQAPGLLVDPPETTPKLSHDTSEPETPETPAAPIDLDNSSISEVSVEFAGAGDAADQYNADLKPAPSVVQPTDEDSSDPDSPLFGAPEPEMPPAPPKPEILTSDAKLVSDEWIEQAKQRYLDNPNKAKPSLEQSANWTKFMAVQKQGDMASLDALLKNKYITDEMHADAVKQLNDSEAARAAAETEYAGALSAYSKEIEAYKSALADWRAANGVKLQAGANQFPGMPETSTKPFYGGEPDWTAAHPGTVSLATALPAIAENGQLARYGISVLVDRASVEDMDMRLRHVINRTNKRKLEVSFKLTSAVADKLTAELHKSGATKDDGVRVNMYDVHSSGLLKRTGKTKYSAKGTTFRATEGAAEIEFRRVGGSSKTQTTNSAIHNTVTLTLPEDATPAQISAALERIGVTPAPASEGDIRVYAENKILSLFAADSDPTQNKSGGSRQKALTDAQVKWGVTPDDLIMAPDAHGRNKLFLSDTVRDKLVGDLKIAGFRHNISGMTSDQWVEFLAGPKTGLQATHYRWADGVNTNGMSSSSDMATGGADYIFTHIMHDSETKTQSWGSTYAVVNPHAAMRRTDVYANASDSYGKRKSGIDLYAMLKGNPHETMFKYGVPVSDLSYVVIGTPPLRKSVLEQLKLRGVYLINGIPAEEFVLGNNQATPNYDPALWSTPSTVVK
jgi:hypothetical protein